jgi:hypothetical protein
MRRLVTLGLALLLVSSAGGGGAEAAAVTPAAPLPGRARPLEDGRFASPLGFRDTVDWYRKELKRRGTNATFVGPVRFRDVTFVRVLPVDPRSAWSAVHIVLADGRTTIYILAASEAGVVAPKLEN